jgi:intracellular septation protein
MKLLLDFLPIILFFGTFRYADGHKEWAAAFATDHLGFLVSGGVVGLGEAPVLLATVVVMVATLTQVAVMLAARMKIHVMLWVSLGLVIVFGGATIWFHSETFIKWKPTALYWLMGSALWVSQALFRKNLLQAVIGDELVLPTPVWRNLNIAWIAFFTLMGLLNLYVAFNYSTSTWADFKVFGATGLMLVFTIAQGIYLSRHLEPDTDAAKASQESAKS